MEQSESRCSACESKLVLRQKPILVNGIGLAFNPDISFLPY